MNRLMHIEMSESEIVLLTAFYSAAHHYVEFGAGGSTCLAAQVVKSSVTAIDSSRDWLDRVATACMEGQTAIQPELIAVDIGPTKNWGKPKGTAHREAWPAYHESPWSRAALANADLFMVDGRFRVACFLQIMLRAEPGAVVLVHDFEERPHYHVVHDMAREIARTEQLSAFVRARDFDPAHAREALEAYRYDWA